MNDIQPTPKETIEMRKAANAHKLRVLNHKIGELQGQAWLLKKQLAYLNRLSLDIKAES